MKPLIYLDYNATTPVDPCVLEYMLPYFNHKFGNAHSRTHAAGWVAEQAVKSAREQVAKLLNCIEQELVFTSGSTEAINIALKGVAQNYSGKGKHIITCSTEHKAVLDTLAYLESQGFLITRLGVDSAGQLDREELKSAFRSDTILVTAMLANNETGVILPIADIADIAHEKGAFLFCDATQAAGKIPVDVQALKVDLLCISAHKFYGPKGAGAIYIRRKDPRVVIPTFLHGGGHEKGIRSGTLNVPAIAGLGMACELAMAEMESDRMRMLQQQQYLEQELKKIEGTIVHGEQSVRLPNTTNIQLKEIMAAELIKQLPGFALAMGSACSSALAEPSHVLTAMGLSPDEAYRSLRISIGKFTEQQELEEFVHELRKVIARSPSH